ncbi:Uncharacterised protein [Mycobacteroides abscessus subsp. abscessus]|nr:Uncharacterised protein [Mycobacteroides abscessus subsp. abscessus]
MGYGHLDGRSDDAACITGKPLQRNSFQKAIQAWGLARDHGKAHSKAADTGSVNPWYSKFLGQIIDDHPCFKIVSGINHQISSRRKLSQK